MADAAAEWRSATFHRRYLTGEFRQLANLLQFRPAGFARRQMPLDRHLGGGVKLAVVERREPRLEIAAAGRRLAGALLGLFQLSIGNPQNVRVLWLAAMPSGATYFAHRSLTSDAKRSAARRGYQLASYDEPP